VTASHPLPRTLEEYITVIDDGVPEWLSRKILAEYGGDGPWEAATVDVATDRPSVRNCHMVNLTSEARCSGQARRRVLEQNVSQLVRSWMVAYHERVLPIGLEDHTGIGLIRYRTGGYYLAHRDAHEDQHRVVSAVAVLHTDFAGGELEFFGGEPTIALRPGQVCLFPSSFQYPHAVLPVTAGTRYSLVTWLR